MGEGYPPHLSLPGPQGKRIKIDRGGSDLGFFAGIFWLFVAYLCYTMLHVYSICFFRARALKSFIYLTNYLRTHSIPLDI